MTPTPRTLALPLVLVLAALMVAIIVPAKAIVPPKDCGFVTVKHHRYNVKADQIRCRAAVPASKRYLAKHRRPKGYHCQDYRGGTSLKFRCEKGIKVFFAIKR